MRVRTALRVIQRKVETLFPFGGDSRCDVALADNYPGTRAKYDRMFLDAMAERYVKAFLYGNYAAAGGEVATQNARWQAGGGRIHPTAWSRSSSGVNATGR